MFFANGKENTNSRKLIFQVTSLLLKLEELQAMEKSEKAHLIFNRHECKFCCVE